MFRIRLSERFVKEVAIGESLLKVTKHHHEVIYEAFDPKFEQ